MHASRTLGLTWRLAVAARVAPRRACRAAAATPSSCSSSSSSSSSSSTRLASRSVASRSYSSRGGSTGNKDKVKFWPFIAVIAVGSAGYIGLVNRRKDMATKNLPPPPPPSSSPTFSSSDVTVIFVLGGPGAGKGTQCANLVKQHGFTHLSAGDLLRAEQERPGSQFGDLIRDYIKNGLIVPMEVTIQLLENAMTEALAKTASATGRFLIDGFPRKLDQAHKFEESVCSAKLVLFFDCPEDVMQSRLLERGKTSGRADDNDESIRKRFRTFVETSMPVVDYYDKQGKVVKIDATPGPDAVFAKTQASLTEKLGNDF